jgi:tetratricopeptide (TPR) repeat protein
LAAPHLAKNHFRAAVDTIQALQRLYGPRSHITWGLLPGVALRVLSPTEQLEQHRYTTEEIRSWTAQKNHQLSIALQRWASERVNPVEATGIFGILLDHTGASDAAIACFTHVAELAIEAGNGKTYVMAVNYITRIYKGRGDNATALARFQEAERWAKSLNDTRTLAGIYANLGDLYVRMSRYDDALVCYYKAEHVDPNTGYARQIEEGIGDIFKYRDEYDRALERYHRSEVITRAQGDKIWLNQTLGKIGTVHRMLGEYDQALVAFQESYALTLALGMRMRLGTRAAI